MRLLAPLRRDPSAPLARANPVAKLAAAVVLFVVLLASVDGVTAGIVLGALVVALPFSGLDLRALVTRAWPIAVMAVAIAALNALFAPAQVGGTAVELGPLRIGSETLGAGVSLGVRLLAIGLAGILSTATTEPVELSDALVQQLRVSPRAAIGAFAALRLVPLLARDWQLAALARRARGVEARSPLGAVQLFAGLVMFLLVAAVRRATRMALAMEARGLGAADCRTVTRVQRMRSADWGWVAAAGSVAFLAVGVSLALGTWEPLLG